MKVLGGVLCLTGALLLVGCAPDAEERMPPPELVRSTVPADSVPLFLDEPQDDADRVDEVDVTSFGIDPATVRYQGEWDGRQIFLGVSGEFRVQLIIGTDGTPEWSAGGSLGNSPIGSNTDWTGDGEMTVQYLPHGTSDVPEGWRALSDWIIVRD